MQVLGLVLIAVLVLIMLAVAVVLMPVLLLRPFDYRKVAYRAGVLTVVAMMLVILGPALHDEHLSPLHLQSVLEVLGAMVIAALFGALIGYVNFRFLRKLSETYAMREETLVEREREKSRTRDGEGSALDSERG